jgi:glycosyltransferase involved in cell wall biosynthesis
MNVGGPAVQVSGIAKNIDSEEFDHRLVTGFCENDEIDYLDMHNFPLQVERIEGLGRSLNLISDIRAFFKIRSIIKKFRPHIVHTHTAKAGFLGRLASLSVKTTSLRVHTFHGHLLSGYFSPLKTEFVIFIERILAHFSDVLIGVGQKVVDDLIVAGIGYGKKYRVINPGLEIATKHNRNQTREKLSIEHDDFVIAWVGRFADIKAPQRVLAIARKCLTSQKRIKFLMIGGGSLLQSVQEESESEKLPILFLGWRSDPEDLIAASDLLLMTSKNEGTPISAIQAQVLGVPVLSTDVGAINEIVIDGKTGYIAPFDAEHFQELISRLAGNELLWQSQSRHAKSQAQNRFSIERLVKDHEELYKDLTLKHQAN